ncbi:MAG: flagellar basal-body rod protein FlgG [Fimbriimonas sp.]
MMRALNTSSTGMVAQQNNLDTIANNLANVNTTGFKQQRAEFQDLMYQTYRTSGATTGANSRQPVALQIGLGTQFTSTGTNFSQGPLQTTGNPLDLAVQGDGFFRVLKPDGTVAYTRDGTFKRDATGLVVTSDGYPLEPPLTIPPGATGITVSNTGKVSAILPGNPEVQELPGGIEITTFANPAGLQRVGQNLYVKGAASGDPADGTAGEEGRGEVRQYVIEGSNVQVVEEMVRMITAQRAYEINSKAIQTSDDMLGVVNGLKR